VNLTLVAARDEPISCLRGLAPAEVEALGRDVVYLIHLEVPFILGRYAFRHYIGTAHAGKFMNRMVQHRTGKGSKFLRLALRAGITWHISRVWVIPAGQTLSGEERRIKNMGGASRSCPSCGIVPLAERQKYRDGSGRYVKIPRRAA
jgi:predicted GIY-YIG superfamily endonuclease